MTRRDYKASRRFLVLYYASSRLGKDNWSRTGRCATLLNAKVRAAEHLIREHWHKAVVVDLWTGDTVATVTSGMMNW